MQIQRVTAPIAESLGLKDKSGALVTEITPGLPAEKAGLRSGDVIVMGDDARLIHHGVDRIVPGTCNLIGEPGRFNLTLRRVTPPTA